MRRRNKKKYIYWTKGLIEGLVEKNREHSKLFRQENLLISVKWTSNERLRRKKKIQIKFWHMLSKIQGFSHL